MLRPFEIHEPESVPDASRLLVRYGDEAAVYAGGTELIPIMKEGLAHFRHLINIKTIGGLDAITVNDGVLRIGALATHRQIERSQHVQTNLPVLSRVAAAVANLRVRNVGTLGGNLCFAEPHSDPAAVLLACGAAMVLVGGSAERRVPAEGFFTGILQTVRRPDELLVGVEVEVLVPNIGAAYERFATHERPTAGVAAVLGVREGVIQSARIAIGSVGPIPARASDAEAALVGKQAVPHILRKAAAIAGQTADILDDLYGSVDFKRHIVTVLAGHALRDAAARAGTPVN